MRRQVAKHGPHHPHGGLFRGSPPQKKPRQPRGDVLTRTRVCVGICSIILVLLLFFDLFTYVIPTFSLLHELSNVVQLCSMLSINFVLDGV